MTTQLLDPDEFLHEFGRFVSVFSGVENTLFLYLCHIIGLKHEECTAILNGQKIDQCISTIKRLFEVRKRVIPSDLGDALEKLAHINKLRNNLLHCGASPYGTVSDHLKALPARVKTFAITSQDLTDATDDLARISAILSDTHIPRKNLPRDLNDLFDQALAKPWQSKFLLQKSQGRQNQPNFQKRKHQPKPSP